MKCEIKLFSNDFLSEISKINKSSSGKMIFISGFPPKISIINERAQYDMKMEKILLINKAKGREGLFEIDTEEQHTVFPLY